MTTRKRIEAVARDRFGFAALRPGQAEAVASVLDGRDTLAVMPTGAGKSAIYQIAALLTDGPTIVVSPLIALQRDQVQALEERGIADAAHANSATSAADRKEAFEDLHTGDLEFVFVAPEQFDNEETWANVTATPPSLFVVDEAHCIAAWGHDFRPDYLRLGEVVEKLGRPPILALTATASHFVRDEIVRALGMRTPDVIVHGFDRPNLELSVERFVDEASKRDALIERVASSKTPGIVYVATRREAEDLAGDLWKRDMAAVYYHGGMSAREREASQEAWMEDAFRIVVATPAFGMGIDKPNVRFVFHYDIPDSPDSYYQEIGRAGRDGEPAAAHLFYRSEDLGLRRFFAGGEGPRSEIEQSRVDMMRAYAETRDCRREFLLNYFGEDYTPPCGSCDNCISGIVTGDDDHDRPFPLSSSVAHPEWGTGVVVRYEGDKIVVLFESAGYKTLSLRTIQERGLLDPA